jgi:hypothetical protein
MISSALPFTIVEESRRVFRNQYLWIALTLSVQAASKVDSTKRKEALAWKARN